MPSDRGRGGSPARGGKPSGGKGKGSSASAGGSRSASKSGPKSASAAKPARPAAGPGTRFGPAMAGERSGGPRFGQTDAGPGRGKPVGARPGGGKSGGGKAGPGKNNGWVPKRESGDDDWAVSGKPARKMASGPSKADVRVAAATAGAAPLDRDNKPKGKRAQAAAAGESRPPRGAGPRDGAPRAPRPPRDVDAGPRYPRTPRPTAAEGDEPLEVEAPREKDLVYGRHPAMAALQGDRPVNKVWVLKDLKNQQLVSEIKQLAKAKGASVQIVERQKLDALSLDGNHQGIVVSIAAAAYVDLDEAMAKALEQPYPALLILDGIEDPHNLGALVRTAEGAGFAGVVIPARRAVGLTPVVAKSSAGAIDRLPVARVGNLAQALDALKKAGFWLVGADSEGEKLPYEVDLTQPLALVIGGEGKGLGRLLSEKCDHRVRLTLGGELESLNASVAGGVLMYEAVRQRWAAAPKA